MREEAVEEKGLNLRFYGCEKPDCPKGKVVTRKVTVVVNGTAYRVSWASFEEHAKRWTLS